MKYNMKTDLWVKLLLWACILMFLPMMFFVPQDEIWILALSTLVMAVIIVPLFRAYYELNEDGIVMHMYGFKKVIQYDNIKSFRKCSNWYSSAAMSRERIEIIQHNKSVLTRKLYISPESRDEFINELKRNCRNLENIEETNNVWE